jgi:hypothetical protein
MRKTTILLGTAGIGAGVWYVLNHFRGDQGKQNGEELQVSGDQSENNEDQRKNAEWNLSANDDSTYATAPKKSAAQTTRVEDHDENILDLDFEPDIDDRGTDQGEATEILMKIRDVGFDASNEKLAIALGRPIEEIDGWMAGTLTIDGDVLMKARALAIERGLEIGQDY